MLTCACTRALRIFSMSLRLSRPQHSPHCDANVPQRPGFHNSFNDVLLKGSCLDEKGTFGSRSTGGGCTHPMVRSLHPRTAIHTQMSVTLLSYYVEFSVLCVPHKRAITVHEHGTRRHSPSFAPSIVGSFSMTSISYLLFYVHRVTVC